MEITSLPTESLHKFLAFSGLLILTVLPAYLYKMYMQVVQKVVEAETEAEIITHQRRFSEAAIEISKAELSRNTAMMDLIKNSETKADRLPDDNFKNMSSIIKSNEDSLIKMQEKMLEMGVAGARFSGNVKMVRELHDQLVLLRRATYFAFFIGLMASGVGFYRWYEIQAYIDKAIKNEALKK
jgi:hypothetical protein